MSVGRNRTGIGNAPSPTGERFGYHRLLDLMLRYREEPGIDTSALDRRRMLARLQAELNCEPSLLLERGFDKAYRRAVEGV